ncbi:MULTISPECIES: GLPGLI family protein [Chryseobacterium]|uniref:GLPGLI family protein n=1 Tax=Chryseobacterium camelliae TaxID=1265445 RepID=A0ABU0TFE5_9FLAO|nr:MULTISPECIES: GLPGLI family protein [Chryseobacterium]MDT3406421.1 GLPGLI family protein [Pseudacidovorax intermedius]MDQ1095779.1 GLPGLI family protein [Chryseobacterium camelliae]MDQ1099716.1 GLPGLI family protein [Chryseobacterium sp. SORGH_AS_1048]MDR6087064.1 GLPGLI family protein [Chryseobacterium sp. SORGH_AS_0909]MDR6131437.1 GLPGLI family protein [Chryseobacterium sp. SORGH_AS_1175]
MIKIKYFYKKNMISHRVRTLLISFVFLASNLIAQNSRFAYEYTFIPDSTDIKSKRSEIMILDIMKNKSEFYSLDRMKLDSVRVEDHKKKIFKPYQLEKEMISDRVIKYSDNNDIDYITFVGTNRFLVKDDRKLTWKLLPEFSTILDFKVQKATVTFAGRKWIAWFSAEIPIQDGPYKFKGLPGLILRIEDDKAQHIFELKSIGKFTQDFVYPGTDYYQAPPKISYLQYVQAFNNFRKNPIADLIGKIQDQPDKNGKMRTANEILKEIENKEKEKMKKENNIIEIDLLKK